MGPAQVSSGSLLCGPDVCEVRQEGLGPCRCLAPGSRGRRLMRPLLGETRKIGALRRAGADGVHAGVCMLSDILICAVYATKSKSFF